MKLLWGWLPPVDPTFPAFIWAFELLLEYWLTFEPAHTAPDGELEEPPADCAWAG